MNESRKLSIGVQSFEKLLTGGYLYVDKTDLVYKLATEGSQYFLSRPRRFGKSLLTRTLQAYFEGRKTLFKGLAIEKLETEWKKVPVLYLDFAGFNFNYPGMFELAMDEHLQLWEEAFGIAKKSDLPALRFRNLVRGIREKTGERIVLLVDEYDKPLLETEGEERERIRSTLKGFFGNLKSMDDDFRFAWLTGITKFAKVSIFSDLNQLKILSMKREYTTLCGITQAELEATFGPEIDAMAAFQKLSREACLEKLRQQYDGYHFCEDEDIPGVYNPFSLINALDDKKFGVYWFDSATPSSLITALEKNVDQLRELPAQDRITVTASELTSAYEDNHNPLTYLFQAGYLTITGYDARHLEYTLDFPNDEVRARHLEYTLDFPNDEVRYGFLNALVPYVTYKKFANFRALKIAELSDDFEAGNTESVMKCLQGLLAELPYHEGPDAAIKAETVFRNVIASIFLLAGQMVHTEKHTSQGRIDSVVETPEHVYIFEFKVDKPVEEALAQIEQSGCATPYIGDSRTLHKIGAVFSTGTRTLSDWREVLG